MLILPDQNWIVRRLLSGVVPASELNETAQPVSETQMTTIGDRERLRVMYGRVRVGAQVINAVPYGGAALAVQCVWGEGEISSIESVLLNNETPAVSDGHYMGTASQTVNAVLAYGMAQMGVSYSDTLNGIAYSVLRVPMDAAGMEIAAIVNGKKLYDPRSGLTVWSDNPALALADFLSSTVYGMGLSVDWASVTTVANACDELVSGVKRRRLGLVIDEARTTQEWLNTLRTYAGCWVVIDGSGAKLVADRPRSTDKTILHASGQIAALGKISKRGTSALPNAVEIIYTDTSVVPWREASVLSPTMGLPSGLPPSQVALPGIQNASQARREAIERINKLWLSDLSVELTLFDDGVAVEVGDVIEVTHPIGLSAKKMRVLDVANDYGRFRVSASEYDPAVYSDAVATDPSYPDTNLPSPADPPVPTGLTLTEVQYQRADGTWGTAINVTWSSASFSYLSSYRVEVWESGSLVDAATVATSSYRTPIVQDGKTYTVKVATISSVGASSAWASNNLTALGVYLPPDPVPSGSLLAYEAGGIVFLQWNEAPDAWRYRIKRGTTSQTYAQAGTVDLADGLRYMDKTAAVGTWRYWVESVDSVAVESGTPRSVDVVVTLDNNAFLVDSKDQTAPTLSNMLEYANNRSDGIRHFVTNDGVSWNSKFTGAMNGYTNPVYSYFATVASSWTGEAEDFGQDLSGDWRATATVEALAGSVTSELQTATVAAYPTFTGAGGMTAKATGRYGRIRHSAAIGSSIHAQIPTQNIRVDAIPREEVIDFTSSASGAVTLTLSNAYSKAKRIVVQPTGNTARFGLYDNVVVGTPTKVDVHVFNDSGARIASAGQMIFQGV